MLSAESTKNHWGIRQNEIGSYGDPLSCLFPEHKKDTKDS